MCLQCAVGSKVFALPGDEDVLPGYRLHVSTGGAEVDWPVGWYGLVRVNDPDFIFPLVLQPKDDSETRDAITELEEYLYGRAGVCHDLVAACIAAGCNPMATVTMTDRPFSYVSTARVAEWLYYRLVEWIKTHPLESNEVCG